MRLALIGLRYGVSYLPAIAALPSASLVAVGARGSRWSREVARELGLPLHRSVEALLAAARPAAAIVAVPGDAAMTVVPTLHDAGVHVLCEFPIHAALAQAAQRSARRSGACFRVNAHFPDLPAPRAFIRACRRSGPPLVVDVVGHERTLYVCLETIHRATGQPFVPRQALGGAVCTGSVARAPAALRVTPLAGPVDDGADVFFGQRISMAFADRTLTLVDSFGPLLASRSSFVDLRTLVVAAAPRSIPRLREAANRAVLRTFLADCRRATGFDTASVLEVATSYSATVARLLGA